MSVEVGHTYGAIVLPLTAAPGRTSGTAAGGGALERKTAGFAHSEGCYRDWREYVLTGHKHVSCDKRVHYTM